MRYTRALLAGGVGFAVSCLAACGGGAGLLSSDQAGNLSNRLDQLSSAVSSHHCGQASQWGGALERAVVNLPSTVNATVRSNLSQGASTVAELAVHQCQQTTTSTTTTSSTASSTSSSTATVTSTSATRMATSTTSSATTNAGPGNTSTSPNGGVPLPGATTTAGGGGGGGY